MTTPVPTEYITEVDRRLDQALRTYSEASIEITRTSMYLLAATIRAARPEARTVECEWSDQGPHLTLCTVDDDDDVDDLMDVADGYVTNLDEGTESVWNAYGKTDGRSWTFDLDKLLTALNDTIWQPEDAAGNPICGKDFMAGTICSDAPGHEGPHSCVCQTCGGDWMNSTCTCRSNREE